MTHSGGTFGELFNFVEENILGDFYMICEISSNLGEIRYIGALQKKSG